MYQESDEAGFDYEDWNFIGQLLVVAGQTVISISAILMDQERALERREIDQLSRLTNER